MKTVNKAGLDIGYSNVKVAFGDGDSPPETVVLPAGAGPIDQASKAMINNPGAEEAFHVQVAGKQWVAGIEPDRIEGVEREVHTNYPRTDVYRALFHAAMLYTGADEITTLVTGLPVAEYNDGKNATNLAASLTGRHVITEDRSILVHNVEVLPQPVGGFLDYAFHINNDEVLRQGRLLVLDPGFFSFDWALFQGSELRLKSSGTSLNAMSAVIENVSRCLREEAHVKVPVERIERELRAGNHSIISGNKRHSLDGYLEEALSELGTQALTALQRTLRRDDATVDVVYIVGGGAMLYRDFAAKVFNLSEIVVAPNPVLSNVRGFYYFGA